LGEERRGEERRGEERRGFTTEPQRAQRGERGGIICWERRGERRGGMGRGKGDAEG